MRNASLILRRGFFAVVAGLSVLGATRHATASLLTYTETATGNFTLNGTGFTNTSFALSTTANTTSIVNNGGIYFIISPTTLSIAGTSPTSFTDAVQVVSNTTSNPSVGFGDNTTNLAILFDAAAVGSYDLRTPFGPISGVPVLNVGSGFTTAAGTFVINSVSTVSFQATAVPEPASLGLIGLSGVALLVRRRMPRNSQP